MTPAVSQVFDLEIGEACWRQTESGIKLPLVLVVSHRQEQLNFDLTIHVHKPVSKSKASVALENPGRSDKQKKHCNNLTASYRVSEHQLC